MKNVELVVAAASVTLLLTQAMLLLARAPSCPSRKSPYFLATFLLLFAFSRIVPPGALLRDAILVAGFLPVWLFLSQARDGRERVLGTLAWGAAILVVVAAGILGYHDTLPFLGFRSFAIAVLAVMLLRDIFRHWRHSRSPVALLTFACGCLWLAGGAANAAARVFAGPSDLLEAVPALMVCGCTGWLVFEEGYPLRPGWGGGLEGARDGEWVARSTRQRLLATEDALVQQDELVGAGVLALGVAHEFKNTLSCMRATAQHALAVESREAKDKGLQLLVEQTDAGADSTIGLLERVAFAGRQGPCGVDAARDLAGFFGRLRASFRGEGVLLQADLASIPRFLARQNEIEQILLNLVRNAVDGYRARKTDGKKAITVCGRRSGEWALLTVEDAAGGVPVTRVENLFSISSSGHGSTGLGLYLSRSLAVSNGGTLDYQPTEGGSIFTLALPVAEEGE